MRKGVYLPETAVNRRPDMPGGPHEKRLPDARRVKENTKEKGRDYPFTYAGRGLETRAIYESHVTDH